MKIIVEIECPDEGEQPFIVDGVMEVAANCNASSVRWCRDFGDAPRNWYTTEVGA